MCGAGGCAGDQRTHRAWDAIYRKRASDWGKVAVCEPLYCDLSWDAPVVRDEQFATSLGGVPATRNPGARPLDEFGRFVRVMGIPVPRFAR